MFAFTLSCPQTTFRWPASKEKVFKCVFFLFILFAVYTTSASVKSTNSSQDCPTTQQGEGCTLGLTKEQPTDSCYHILTCNHHIWSYAAGQREDTSTEGNCPCAAHPSTEPLTPDYVGDHYYCDTATYYTPKVEWYTNNTLWDGKDCYPGSKCCDNERLPWFWRTLPQETTDDVEVRWCTTNGIGHDKVSTELLEVFVH